MEHLTAPFPIIYRAINYFFNMGCSSDAHIKEIKTAQEDDLSKLSDLIKEYKKGIEEYKRYKEYYETILSLQQKTNDELNLYFKLKGDKNVRLEQGLISTYPAVLSKVSKIEDKLQLNPNNINIK